MSKAQTLRQLHQGPAILVLPNAWDVVSARIFEEAEFPAIGTTSAGVAFTLGYPDGQKISRAEMLDVVRRIARKVAVPVTADVEAGYGDPVETARQVWAVGAVGMNLEDTAGGNLIDLAAQTEAIRGIRKEIPEMVINARTDIFLNAIGEEATRFDRAVERLNAYRDAGADCLFAPGVVDREAIGRLAKSVHGPLNILAIAKSPTTGELQSLGVARVSVGGGPMRAALGVVRRVAAELHDRGSYASMSEGAVSYAEIQKMLQ